jgi:hypothetical protein
VSFSTTLNLIPAISIYINGTRDKMESFGSILSLISQVTQINNKETCLQSDKGVWLKNLVCAILKAQQFKEVKGT